MGRLAAGVVVLALATAGSALAAGGQPQKRHTPADMAKARSIVLRPADVGAGWTSKPSTSGGGTPRCKNFQPDQSDLVETGTADSPDFSKGGGSRYLSSSAGVFKTAAQAQASWNRVVKPGLLTCLQSLFEQGASSGGTTTKVTGTGVLSLPKLAARTAGYRLFFVASNASVSLKGAVDVVLLGHGRIDSVLLYVAFGTPSQALERRLAGIIASRIA